MSDNIKDDIIVKFELFDNIGFYGNVPIPQYDVSLKTATANLEKSIDQSLFKFTLKIIMIKIDVITTINKGSKYLNGCLFPKLIIVGFPLYSFFIIDMSQGTPRQT